MRLREVLWVRSEGGVPVEEPEGLLAQHHEDAVHHGQQLACREDHAPQARGVVAVRVLRRPGESAPRHDVHMLRGPANHRRPFFKPPTEALFRAQSTLAAAFSSHRQRGVSVASGVPADRVPEGEAPVRREQVEQMAPDTNEADEAHQRQAEVPHAQRALELQRPAGELSRRRLEQWVRQRCGGRSGIVRRRRGEMERGETHFLFFINRGPAKQNAR